MKFVVEKKQKRNPIKGNRLNLRTVNAENNFLNSGIVNGTLDFNFISTETGLGEMEHVIQVSMNGYENEAEFENMAKLADQSSFTINDTNFILPIDYFDITSFELLKEAPSYRVESFINYYDVSIDNRLKTGITMPNIYKETIKKPKISKSVIKNDIQTGNVHPNTATKAIFDNKFKLSQANSNKTEYPCFCEIVVSKKDNNIFTKTLSKLDLYSFFMNDVTEKMFNEVRLSDKTDTTSANLWKSNFLRYLIANISSDSLDVNSVISNRTNESKTKINFLDKLEAIGDIQKESVANSNFKSVINNKTVPNETVFYKIEKFIGSQVDNVSKTFLMPSESDVMTFIDTEVAYNSTYSYKVTAYVIIYGTQYTYHYLNSDFVSKKVKYKVVSTPSPVMVEVMLFSRQTTPSTTPPLSPGVTFVNESNSKKSIKMIFSLRQGREMAHFIKVLPEDIGYVFKKHIGSDLTRFAYNKEPIQVEILQLDKKPISIFDFQNGSRTTLSDIDSLSNPEILIHKENLFPNKKYYYTFRTISQTGMVSNPTAVYEVELVKDADESKIISKIIEVDRDKPTTPSLSMRKLLQVRPALHQSIINRKNKNDDLSDATIGEIENRTATPLSTYSVGTAESSIWGRKIKIRVKSNDSGKMIDFNVKFDLIKDEKNEDL